VNLIKIVYMVDDFIPKVSLKTRISCLQLAHFYTFFCFCLFLEFDYQITPFFLFCYCYIISSFKMFKNLLINLTLSVPEWRDGAQARSVDVV